MALYRKKTLTPIEKYVPGMEDGFKDGKPFIRTNLGDMLILPTDWIATGVAGERYPIRVEIFLEMYELVKE